MEESKGIIMFNRGSGIVVRAIVSLFSIRKHYDGPITFFVEKPYPQEFDEVLKIFKCDIVHLEEKHDYKTLVRKNSLFELSPYDKTLWLDADIIVDGSLDAMFEFLDEKNVDFCIPSFCQWKSTGGHISKRIKRFEEIAEDKYVKEALKEHDAINTGVFSFRKSEKWLEFARYWTSLADKGAKAGIFIPDETACQVLYPSMGDWGLKYFIAPTNYNVSPIHDHGKSSNPIIRHFHGDKHCLNGVESCKIWIDTFNDMCKSNIANINSFLKYADKRLAKFLKGEIVNVPKSNEENVTIVTAIDEHYLPFLEATYPNWRKYKNIDTHPVIVFVNGINIDSDKRLDFLRLPNVTMINWDESCMEPVESHRELMLSAFVFGTAEHVKTDYWLKIDSDSYATDYRSFITSKMKEYAFFGHKWSYSRVEHIRQLDEWRNSCWHKKIKNAPPMIDEGKIEGTRFYHNSKRTISFIQLHKSKFTRYCVKVIGKKKLPAPTQDTTMFYFLNRLEPDLVGVGNFKKDYGFTQGNGRLGVENLKLKLDAIEKLNLKKEDIFVDKCDEVINDEYEVDKNEDVVANKSQDGEDYWGAVGKLLNEKYNSENKENKEKRFFPLIKRDYNIEFPAICHIPEGNEFMVVIKEVD